MLHAVISIKKSIACKQLVARCINLVERAIMVKWVIGDN
jgi:hypothetical protein